MNLGASDWRPPDHEIYYCVLTTSSVFMTLLRELWEESRCGLGIILPILLGLFTFPFVYSRICYVNITLFLFCSIAMTACKLYEQLRREAAAIRIQKNFRCYTAQQSYLTLKDSAVLLQTGMRAMTARNEFRFRKQTKAAIKIQVLLWLPILHKWSDESVGSWNWQRTV